MLFFLSLSYLVTLVPAQSDLTSLFCGNNPELCEMVYQYHPMACTKGATCNLHTSLCQYLPIPANECPELLRAQRSNEKKVLGNLDRVGMSRTSQVNLGMSQCTLSFGYWKNNVNLTIPFYPITLGCPTTGTVNGTVVNSTTMTTFILGNSGDSSNGLNKLATQLLAAEFNLANGAILPIEFNNTIAAANALLCSYGFNNSNLWKSLSSSTQTYINNITAMLTTYNSDVCWNATTHAPTGQPTNPPSNAPTRSPTAPTNAPTSPTNSPTAPTNAPTERPTSQPTEAPTSPTNAPTERPTNQPTEAPTAPTNAPTEKPTSQPTEAPTVPTEAPTNQPTNQPTEAPTSPTNAPTERPTNQPTEAPTSPTNAPTERPTSQPTEAPTAPTEAPTNQPTNQPTEAPTSPTNAPTEKPTNQPTEAPTAPTEAPTNQPTSQPTEAPTSPTNAPTNQPTNQPTKAPTSPTNTPTERPTISPTPFTVPPIPPSILHPTPIPIPPPTPPPTPQPTSAPTNPTIAPTHQPTEAPTSPTNAPTSPTNAPTSPTTAPTRKPTGQPTNSPTSSTRSPTPAPTAPIVCTLTIGYWKNKKHNYNQFLPIMLGCYTTGYINGTIVVNKQQGDQILMFSNLIGGASDGLNKLAAQLLGAELNIANGANVPANFEAAIMAAQLALCQYGFNPGLWSSLNNTIQNYIIGLAATLDSYNNDTCWPANIPTQSPTKAPTNTPTEAPTEVPTNIPTQAPTATPRCVNNTHFFSAPNETYCLAPGITQVCQLPPGSSLTCLTFDDVLVGSSPVPITNYRNYTFSGGVVSIENNTFFPGFNFSSTWPNFVFFSSVSTLLTISAPSPFDILSLTFRHLVGTLPINILGYNLENLQIYSYVIDGLIGEPNFIILNWNNVTKIQFTPSVSVYLDSIVITQRD